MPEDRENPTTTQTMIIQCPTPGCSARLEISINVTKGVADARQVNVALKNFKALGPESHSEGCDQTGYNVSWETT